MPFRDRITALVGGGLADLSQETFDPFLQDHPLVFVDFWASWCRPCRAMAPVIRSLARTYGEVAFAKVDTEREEGLRDRFGVRSIPTYILFKRRRIVERFSGVTSRDRLATKIEKWR